MPLWTDDPELLATFRAEVDERLASLSTGLLQLEAAPRSREVMQGLLRDTHTLKGSSRMLGLSDLVALSHAAEEVLTSIRDGRVSLTRHVIDLLLSACELIGRGAPGGDLLEGDPDVVALIDSLEGAAELTPEPMPVFAPPVRLVGHDPAPGPALPPTVAPPTVAPPVGTAAPAASLRVSVARMRTVLEGVEEVNQGARRLDGTLRAAAEAGAEVSRWADALAAALPEGLDNEAASALLRLRAAAATVTAASGGSGDACEEQLDRLDLLRDHAMQLAMVSVRQVLAGYPGLVRRLATDAGVEATLVLVGEDVELDKRVLDAVSDALGHLVTNAVDHGCEPAEVRLAAGKTRAATITVAARSAGPAIVLTVSDDGAGIDRAALVAAAQLRHIPVPTGGVDSDATLELLFHPGFSTRQAVTSSSGRGVGLDAVRTAVQAVGGDVTVRSILGRGTTIEATLPVSLGVMHCLLATVGDQVVAVPATAVREAVSLTDLAVQQVAGAPLVVHRDATLALVSLGTLLGDDTGAAMARHTGLVVPHGGDSLMWAVDEVIADREVVVHDLGSFLTPGGVPGVAGATFDDDGRVVCLLDVRETSELLLGGGGAPHVPRQRGAREAATVLVVEDSVAVRELERAVLTEAGYSVTTCIDGLQAHALLAGPPVDLVLSDVEMPGLTGIELTRAIRRTPGWADVPVVLMTSLSGDADRRAGLAAGASAYLLKSGFAPAELVGAVRRLIGR